MTKHLRKRLLLALTTLLVAVTASLLATGTANAASGMTTTINTFTNANGQLWESALDGDWTIGDCTMLANAHVNGGDYSFVRISRTDDSGRVSVGLFTATKTVRSPTDVWWTKLTFLTSFGSPLLVTPTLQGAQMRVTNAVYTYQAFAELTLDPQLFPLIAAVRWESSC